MPLYSMEIVINHNRFPEIQRKAPVQAKKIVAATVLQILAEADPPVDTGNLKGFVSVTENSVTWHAYYAGFVNYGTSKMAARPFVDNAVAAVQPMFVQAIETMVKAL